MRFTERSANNAFSFFSLFSVSLAGGRILFFVVFGGGTPGKELQGRLQRFLAPVSSFSLMCDKRLSSVSSFF